MDILRSLALAATTLACACGSDGNSAADAGGDAAADAAVVPPRVIAGGGIGDGPIAGVANVYVIDDSTRQPVAGAAVTVGSTAGTTDATGLFVAHGVTGKQTVLVTAAGYRSELWVGANGANLTIDVQAAPLPTPGHASLTGRVDVSAFPVATNHIRVVLGTYSQDDRASDAANNLAQNGANACLVAAGSGSDQSCEVTITSRTGQVALAAAIVDDDTKGTQTSTDDTLTVVGWAYRTGVTVVDGVAQTGLDFTTVPGVMTQTEHVDFASPPVAQLPVVGGVIGIELGSAGTLQLPSLVGVAPPELVVPQLAVFGAGATYRLTGIAKASSAADAAASVTLVHAQAGATLTSPAWLLPPTAATVTRTGATWTAIAGTSVQGVTLTSGTTDVLSVTVFDGTTSVVFPAGAGVPATGALTAKVSGIAAPGLDLGNFSLDADRTKITGEVSTPASVAN